MQEFILVLKSNTCFIFQPGPCS